MVKKLAKTMIIVVAAVVLLAAWAPWLTEEYGKDKVLEYFNQSYGVDKSDIRVGSIEKKPFEIDFGLYLSPSNKSLPETSVSARINFYGDMKHEILSAPWFTEENAKEKVLEYFSQKYGVDKKDIKIESFEQKPLEIDFGLFFLPPNVRPPISYGYVVHAWVTVYGEVKYEPIKSLS